MVHAGFAAGPPRLFSWTVVVKPGDPPDLGALGVTDDRTRAFTALSDALRDAPAGSHGLFHEVTVNVVRVGYWYDKGVRVDVDQDGKLILDALAPAVGGWGRLKHLFGDAFPGLQGVAR